MLCVAQAQPLRRSTTFAVTASRRPSLPARSLRPAVYSQRQEERPLHEKLAGPAAAVLGAALLFAATPDEALAARSGGRVGGSSGFSRARSAPAPSASPRITNNNVYVAPPVVGGWGFGMPMFGGFGFYPTFGFGFGLSTIFNIMILLFVVNFVLSVVSGLTNQKKKDSFDDEKW